MFVTAPRFARPPRAALTWPALAILAPLVVAGLWLSFRLWPEWTSNPDLSHGLFAPAIFLLLVWEGTRTGPQRWVRASRWTTLAIALAAAAALAMYALGGLLAASLGWSHSAVVFSLTASFALGLGAALLVAADERVRAVPFNWTILTAIGLWLLVAPLPSGTYARLTFGLQGWVTGSVLTSLHLLGIPARQIGNIIELANTSVGVEEACSGIRSLLSCLYAGFFFAAWLVRTPGRRIFLILCAPVLAIGMNFARSLGLTLLADRGVDIAGFWHDATGYAILGLTAATLAGLAALLSPAGAPVAPAAVPATAGPARGPLLAFGSGALAVGALALLFALLTPRSSRAPSPGDIAAIDTLFPAAPAGWRVNDRDDLYRFSGVLRTERLAERTYVRVAAGQPPLQINAYLAYWSPGEASVSMVASHTPDACWPGAGWEPLPTETPRVALAVAGGTLPPAEHRVFRLGGSPQHVWFWHLYDGRPTDYLNPRSIPALVRLSLNYGFRREGSQYFVRFSSNRPWEEISGEPVVQELFANLARIGLRP